MIEPNESLLNAVVDRSVTLGREAYPKSPVSWADDYELIKTQSDNSATSLNFVAGSLYETQVELLETQVLVDGIAMDVDQLKIDVSQLQLDVTQLQLDVSQLQIDVTLLDSAVVQLQTDVTELQDRPFGRASYNSALNVLDNTTVRVPLSGFVGSGITLASNALTINSDYTYTYSYRLSGTFGALTTTINLAGVLFNGTGAVNTIEIPDFKSLVATNEFYIEIVNTSGGDINIPDLSCLLSIEKVSL